MHRRRRCFPLITSSICIALITTHIITGIINTNKLLYAASPMMTFTLSKYYTLITSAFLHTTLQHLIGNLLFLIAIGSTLEHKYGSIIFLYYSLLLVPLTALATALTYSLLQIFDMQYYSTGVIGYSGVIFGYLAIYAWGGRYSQWNICGYNILLYVPIIFLIYQTIILIYQLKYSQTSITIHIWGLIIGYLISRDVFTGCAYFERLVRWLENAVDLKGKLNFVETNGEQFCQLGMSENEKTKESLRELEYRIFTEDV